MSALFGSLLTKAAPYLVMAIAAILAFFGVRKAGADREKARQAQARLEDVSEAKEIEDAIAGRTDAENRKELGKWKRKS